ncbi:MAG: flavodoxin family protein [Candidatus Humimicrobiaceae bacterium]
MKINIVYASWFGNGEKIVKELAEILKARGQEVILFRVNEKVMDNLPFADLYIFSSPTRKFALPPEMKKSIENFSLNSEGAKFALITTYLDPRTIGLKDGITS